MSSIKGSWVESIIEYNVRILLVLISYIQSLFQNFQISLAYIAKTTFEEESAKIIIANKESRYFHFIDKEICS